MDYRVDIFYCNGKRSKAYFNCLEDALAFGRYQAASIHTICAFLLTRTIDNSYVVDSQILTDPADPDDLFLEVCRA